MGEIVVDPRHQESCNERSRESLIGGGNDVTAEQLLNEIADYCRRVGMAESTFGRRAVNDGKLVSRLRIGGRVTMETVERVRTFMTDHATLETRGLRLRSSAESLNGHPGITPNTNARLGLGAPQTAIAGSKNNFRFYDNRQKYLLFVNTWSSRTSIRGRPPSGCSMRGSGTGPCSRG